MSHTLSERALSLVRWRARRGLLENDLVLTEFLDQHGSSLSNEQVAALMHLLKIDDNQLMDLLLGRAAPEGEYDTPEIRALLDLIRQKPSTTSL